MKFFLKVIIFLFFFQIQNSFAAMVTKLDDKVFQDAADSEEHTVMGGPEFNKDGTKMYVSYHNDASLENGGDDDYIAE